MSLNNQLVTRWIPIESQQFNLQNTCCSSGRKGNISFCLKHRICFSHQEMLLSDTPIAERIIIAKHGLCYFGKKKQDFHRTLQLHCSSSLLYLGISANLGWVGQCGCVLHQEMLLRVSKNRDVGSPGAWKGKQGGGSCRSPKVRSKHTDSMWRAESLKGYFPPFPYYFQATKCHEKEDTGSKQRGIQH